MGRYRYDLGIDDDILLAIGNVSAQWSVLEYYVSRTTIACLHMFENEPSEHFDRTSFMLRRTAFYESLIWPNVHAEAQTAGMTLILRIEEAEDKRHKIIHGMATQFEQNQLKGGPRQAHFSRPHPTKLWFDQNFTSAQIMQIANEIADINGDLIHFYFYLWGNGPCPSL